MVKRIKSALTVLVLLNASVEPASSNAQFACQMLDDKYTCQFNPIKGQSMINQDWISDEETDLKSGKRRHGKGGSNPLFEFLAGCVMITMAFPCIWMNERREVRTWKLIAKAEESVKKVKDPNEIDEGLNEELVHVQGEIVSASGLADHAYEQISLSDCLVLKRNVWKYTRIEGDDDTADTFQWSSQTNSGEKDGSYKWYNDTATLGGYRIAEHSLELITKFKDVSLAEYEGIQSSVSDAFSGKETAVEGDAIIVKMEEPDHDEKYASHGQEYRVGDFKISWEYVPANKEWTILAQQMKTDKEDVSLRQWNPERLDVPWGEDNGSAVDSNLAACAKSPCCMISACVEVFFKAAFQEVVHVVTPGKLGRSEVFAELKAGNASMSKAFRCLGWLLLVVGNFLLFSPFIAVLNWIPLVGWLLAGIVWIAAFIWSLVFGTMCFMITMALAWVFYRPLFGLALLVGTGVLIAGCFLIG